MRLYVRRESIGNLDLMKQKNNCRKVTKSLVMNEENRKAERMEEQEGDERVKEDKKGGEPKAKEQEEIAEMKVNQREKRSLPPLFF